MFHAFLTLISRSFLLVFTQFSRQTWRYQNESRSNQTGSHQAILGLFGKTAKNEVEEDLGNCRGGLVGGPRTGGE